MSFGEASCIDFRISVMTYVTYMSIGECRQEKKNWTLINLARNVDNLYLRREHSAVIAGLGREM